MIFRDSGDQKLSRLATELAVVVLGVAIALAADGWRQGVLDDRTARDYETRIRTEVAAGIVALRGVRTRFQRASANGLALSDSLDAPNPDYDALIPLYLEASQVGFDREELASDVAYQELVASGRLALLGDDIRAEVVAYFRASDRLGNVLERLPPLNYEVANATGYFPTEYINEGRELSPEQRSRILDRLQRDPALIGQFRELHAEVTYYDRILTSVIERGERLLTLIQ